MEKRIRVQETGITKSGSYRWKGLGEKGPNSKDKAAGWNVFSGSRSLNPITLHGASVLDEAIKPAVSGI